MAANIKIIYRKIRDFIPEIPGILRKAVVSFQKKEASRNAAGMAYYTLFSLIPLLIVMVTIVSYFVDAQQAAERVSQLVMSVIPVSQGLVERNINRAFEIRNSVGAIGLVSFLWSGSNAFSIMVHNINTAWPEDERRSFFEKRLFGLAMVVLLILMLFMLMISSTALNLVLRYQRAYFDVDPTIQTRLLSLGSNLIHWLVPFIFFYSLYRVVPMGRVPIKASGFSALVITLLWRGASAIFQWYLSSGLARYEFVFGSLSAIVVLLFWIYLSSVILFFGAHVCAASAGKIPDFREQSQ